MVNRTRLTTLLATTTESIITAALGGDGASQGQASDGSLPPSFEQRLQEVEWKFGNETAETNQNIDDFFLLTMGGLVYLMQPGFAFLEGGTVRKKNVTNTLFRNMVGSFVACAAYWAFGYAFAYGHPSNNFIGYGNFALSSTPDIMYSHWFFQFVFAAATNCIVSGAIAERIDIFSYFVYSIFVPGFIYAVITHWTWTPEGWLNNLEFGGYKGAFQDFAGSGGVHVCGGMCALAGAIALGPRIGRFQKSTEVRAASGYEQEASFRSHSVPLVTLGGFLLMFAFIGFNGGSQLSITKISTPEKLRDGYIVSNVVVNTMVSGAFGGIATVAFCKITKRRWSLLQGINGGLAGMVAICSGCNVMYSWAAAVTGFVAGLVYPTWAIIIPKLRIDDPLETVALHGGAGAWGLVAAALFDFDKGIALHFNRDALFFLACQFIGLAAIIAWSLALAGLMFGMLRIYVSRVPVHVELQGLDETRHKEPAYEISDDNQYSSGTKLNVMGGQQRHTPHLQSAALSTYLANGYSGAGTATAASSGYATPSVVALPNADGTYSVAYAHKGAAPSVAAASR